LIPETSLARKWFKYGDFTLFACFVLYDGINIAYFLAATEKGKTRVTGRRKATCPLNAGILSLPKDRGAVEVVEVLPAF
jgi:hypothetical protein